MRGQAETEKYKRYPVDPYDRSELLAVGADHCGEYKERRYADQTGHQRQAMKLGLEGGVGKECGEQPKEYRSMTEHELETAICDREAVQLRQLGWAQDPDDWQGVNGGNQQEYGRDDEAHLQNQGRGVLFVPSAGCDCDYLRGKAAGSGRLLDCARRVRANGAFS